MGARYKEICSHNGSISLQEIIWVHRDQQGLSCMQKKKKKKKKKKSQKKSRYNNNNNNNNNNTDGSFTMADSNSFSSPCKILLIAQENKYLRKFSYSIVKLHVVCTH